MARDGCFVEAVKIRSPVDLVGLVNRLNREGVNVYRRLSPAVLIDLMTAACEQSALFHESLDPFAPAAFAVSWAGEEKSLNWFDTARELTERWHHQQQIRLATNRPGIMVPELYAPVLDCFVRGLPFTFRDVNEPTGTVILVQISGECGGTWRLFRESTGWALFHEGAGEVASRVIIPQALAWRIFTKGIDFEGARAQVEIHGNQQIWARRSFISQRLLRSKRRRQFIDILQQEVRGRCLDTPAGNDTPHFSNQNMRRNPSWAWRGSPSPLCTVPSKLNRRLVVSGCFGFARLVRLKASTMACR